MLSKSQIKREAGCWNRGQHTVGPEDFVLWHGWAEGIAVSHDQSQCPGCGLYIIWTPKTPPTAKIAETTDAVELADAPGP